MLGVGKTSHRRAAQDERVGKTARAHALAQVRDGGRVADEILEAHGLSVAVDGGQWTEVASSR